MDTQMAWKSYLISRDKKFTFTFHVLFLKIYLPHDKREKNYSSFNMEVIKVSLKWKLF